MATDHKGRFGVLQLMLYLALMTVVNAYQHQRGYSLLRRERRDIKADNNRGFGLRIQPRPLQTKKPDDVDDNKPIPVIYDDSHCENGGTGYLGAFCLCPEYFTGRYCENDVRNTSLCGHLGNGDWVYRNCHICFCDNGLMRCELFRLEGCNEGLATPNNQGSHVQSTSCWVSFLTVLSFILNLNQINIVPFR